MKVTITVEMNTPDGGSHTISRSANLSGDDNPNFKAYVAELAIARLGRDIVHEIADAHGDARYRSRPELERPLNTMREPLKKA